MMMWTVMNKVPDFELTSREISILSAFLDIKVLYGIQTDFYTDWSENPKEKIMRTCEKMRQNNLFSYDMSGEIKISSKLYRIIKCMGEPQHLYRVRKTDVNGRKQDYFLYEAGNEYICLEPSKVNKNKIYIFNDRKGIEDILELNQIRKNESKNKQIVIPLHTLYKCRKKVDSFEIKEAEMILKKQLSDEDENVLMLLMESLQGRMSVMYKDLWEWEAGRQTSCESKCFICHEDVLYEISIEDGEKLVLRG